MSGRFWLDADMQFRGVQNARMGTWGVGIFSNDGASDVAGEFRDLVVTGLTADEATARLQEDYAVDQQGNGR